MKTICALLNRDFNIDATSQELSSLVNIFHFIHIHRPIFYPFLLVSWGIFRYLVIV